MYIISEVTNKYLKTNHTLKWFPSPVYHKTFNGVRSPFSVKVFIRASQWNGFSQLCIIPCFLR